MTENYKLNKLAGKLLQILNQIWRVERLRLQRQNGSIIVPSTPAYIVSPSLESELRKQTVFASLDLSLLRTLHDVLYQVFRIANENHPNFKKHEITILNKLVWSHLPDYPITINEKFNYTPVDSFVLIDKSDSQESVASIWRSAVALGKDILQQPQRLKICPFCLDLFWDGQTRPANRRVCDNPDCNRQWIVQRVSQSRKPKTVARKGRVNKKISRQVAMKTKEGTIYLRGSTYWIKFYRSGKAFYESSHSEKISDARYLLNKRLGEKADGKPVSVRRNVPMLELLNDMLTDYEINNRKSASIQKQRLEKNVIPHFGHLRADQITGADIAAYVVQRQKGDTAKKTKPAMNATINRELAALRRAFILGIKNGKIQHKPHFEMLKENNVRRGFFEPSEYIAIREHLPEEIQPVLDFAFQTGWRKNEILCLQWRNVDFKHNRIVLDPCSTKNDDARTFPFTSELRMLLTSQREKTDQLQKLRGIIVSWVFHRRDGRQIKDFYTAWKNALGKAKIADRRLHDCRRTAVRKFSRLGIPDRVGMQLSGHKTRAIYDRYRIVSESDLQEAAKKLDEASETVTKQLQIVNSGNSAPLK